MAECYRSNKRKDESKDEDYVLPSQSRSRRSSPQYSLRRHSNRKTSPDKFTDGGASDSEESLEKGAVEGIGESFASNCILYHIKSTSYLLM